MVFKICKFGDINRIDIKIDFVCLLSHGYGYVYFLETLVFNYKYRGRFEYILLFSLR